MPFSPQPSGGVSGFLGFTFKLWTEELRRPERVDTTEAIGIGADAAPFVGGRERDFVEHRVLFTRNGISQRFAGLRPGRRAAGKMPSIARTSSSLA